MQTLEAGSIVVTGNEGAATASENNVVATRTASKNGSETRLNDNRTSVDLCVCAMRVVRASESVQGILDRITDLFDKIDVSLRIFYLDEETLFGEGAKPQAFPPAHVIWTLFSADLPLERVAEYVERTQAIELNTVAGLQAINNRVKMYQVLRKCNIPIPYHLECIRESDNEKSGKRTTYEPEIIEREDELIVNGNKIRKPFVEKPVNNDPMMLAGSNSNIYVYYPVSAGGGRTLLGRRSQSVIFEETSRIRRRGSYLYEPFIPSDGFETKLYVVASFARREQVYIHAEAQPAIPVKAPVQSNYFNTSAQLVDVAGPRKPNQDANSMLAMNITISQGGKGRLKSAGATPAYSPPPASSAAHRTISVDGSKPQRMATFVDTLIGNNANQDDYQWFRARRNSGGHQHLLNRLQELQDTPITESYEGGIMMVANRAEKLVCPKIAIAFGQTTFQVEILRTDQEAQFFDHKQKKEQKKKSKIEDEADSSMMTEVTPTSVAGRLHAETASPASHGRSTPPASPSILSRGSPAGDTSDSMAGLIANSSVLSKVTIGEEDGSKNKFFVHNINCRNGGIKKGDAAYFEDVSRTIYQEICSRLALAKGCTDDRNRSHNSQLIGWMNSHGPDQSLVPDDEEEPDPNGLALNGRTNTSPEKNSKERVESVYHLRKNSHTIGGLGSNSNPNTVRGGDERRFLAEALRRNPVSPMGDYQVDNMLGPNVTVPNNQYQTVVSDSNGDVMHNNFTSLVNSGNPPTPSASGNSNAIPGNAISSASNAISSNSGASNVGQKLVAVIAVLRHGDRTPKRKLKVSLRLSASSTMQPGFLLGWLHGGEYDVLSKAMRKEEPDHTLRTRTQLKRLAILLNEYIDLENENKRKKRPPVSSASGVIGTAIDEGKLSTMLENAESEAIAEEKPRAKDPTAPSPVTVIQDAVGILEYRLEKTDNMTALPTCKIQLKKADDDKNKKKKLGSVTPAVRDDNVVNDSMVNSPNIHSPSSYCSPRTSGTAFTTGPGPQVGTGAAASSTSTGVNSIPTSVSSVVAGLPPSTLSQASIIGGNPQEREKPDKSDKSEMKPVNAYQEGEFFTVFLTIKWGGNLTGLGRAQALRLGEHFRNKWYPGEDAARLHASLRHDIKIFASKESRCAQTAGSFAKGLLCLDGPIPPVVVSFVRTDTTLMEANLLDSSSEKQFRETIQGILNDPESSERKKLLQALQSSVVNRTLQKCMEKWGPCIMDAAVRELEAIMSELDSVLARVSVDKSTPIFIAYNETVALMRTRWQEYAQELTKNTVSTINKILDASSYDLRHNVGKTLHLSSSGAGISFRTSGAGAHPAEPRLKNESVVTLLTSIRDICLQLSKLSVPFAYGRSIDEKMQIANRFVTPILSKIQWDLRVASQEYTSQEKDAYMYVVGAKKQNVASPVADPPIRTRLYFAHNSHIQCLSNVFRYGGLVNTGQDIDVNIPIYGYLSHVIFRLWKREAPTGGDEFVVGVSVSPGDGMETLYGDVGDGHRIIANVPLDKVDKLIGSITTGSGD